MGAEPNSPESARVCEPVRTWSLRREWSRALTIMLLLLLTPTLVAMAGVKVVVAELSGTAHHLRNESVAITTLRQDLVAHEQMAHKLLSGQPADRSAFVQKQVEITREFAKIDTVFPADSATRASILAAYQSWQDNLITSGLWADQVQALHGNHPGANAAFDTSNDRTLALLAGLEGPSLQELDRGLSHGTDLERILLSALAGVFGLAVAAIAYFRRRLARDLLRPVARISQGVSRVQAGDFDHRIEVARRDELGELAEAFNGMAGALHDNHLSLTLRATRDSLTGLANRASFTEHLAAQFSPGSDRRARQASLIFIDVDDFKDVNDSVGHEGGDALLIQLAARLNHCVRANDLVARLGGDEFAIVVAEDEGGAAAVEVAERILEALRAPFVVGGESLVVTCSIGVAPRRAETTDAAELLRQADFAMYLAKGNGKGQYELYDASRNVVPQGEATVTG